jgi:exodeoxyribonuclease VIII
MKPGVYAGIPNAEYHGGPGISKSGLDLIHRSPMHYHAVVTAANDNHESTAAQAIGTAAHMLILEPAEFVKNYCLGLRPQDVPHAIEDRDQLVAMVAKLNEGRLPKLTTGGAKAEQVARIVEAYAVAPADFIRATAEELEALKGAELKAELEALNEHRAGLLSTSGNRHELAELLRANGVEVTLWSDVQAEWLQNNQGRTVLTQDQWEQLHAMRDAVMAHPAARGVLERGNNMVVDLKTTDDASLDGFSRSIANWRYDVQHPYYLDGLREAISQSGGVIPEAAVDGAAELSAYWVDQETGVLCRCRPDFWRGEPKHFIFIAVEKKKPYAVGVYKLDEESVELGRAVYRGDLRVYAECKANDNWPGYGDKIQTISVPGWHANKNAHLLDAQ